MKLTLAAALCALLPAVGAVHAAGDPQIYRVQLKTGGPGYLLSCSDQLERCTSLGPRLCPGKTAMWSNAQGQFGHVPVTMRKNGPESLMIVRCD